METSEEKTLPASHKKLEDARKKGKISKSQDAVNAANFGALIAVLFALGAVVAGTIDQLFDLVLDATPSVARDGLSFQDFRHELQRAAGASVPALAITLAPVLGAAFAAGILANVVLNKGILFTFEPMKPNLEALDPVKGLKRIFGKRGLFEFLKAVIKLVVLGAVLTIVIAHSLDALVRLPGCGFECVLDAVKAPLFAVLGVALFLFVVAGAVDILIQRRLFLDEMKMTLTEYKRELKDAEGEPLLKQARKRLAREISSSTSKVGAKMASMFIAGPDATVGIRYVTSESRIPLVVLRVTGPQSEAVATAAQEAGLPVVPNAALADGLARTGRAGAPIPQRYFKDVAFALWASGIARQ